MGRGGRQARGAWRVGLQPPSSSLQRSSTGSRLLDRSSRFKQSAGRLNIRRIADNQRSIWHLRDFFHTLVNMSTAKLLVVVCSVIVLNWMVFAMFFLMVSKQCGLQAGTYLRSLYLAIETVQTIGFGIPDNFFNDCSSGVVVIGASGISGSLLQALVLSLVYTRMSRPQCRARTVVFTEKGLLCEIRGQVYFMVQVCDLRKHQLVEAHIRLYCVQHAPTGCGVVFQTRAMRLQHPDDDLGSMLLLSLPQLIVHRVDPWSPLWPQDDAEGGRSPRSSFAFPDAAQRAVDAECGNRDAGARSPATTLERVSSRVRDGELEVLCIVEGIDPTTSATLQARHSYTVDDMVVNAAFQPCVSRAVDGACEIDFDAFHEVVQVDGEDVGACAQSMA